MLETEIASLFLTVGINAQDIAIVRDKQTGRHKHCAFITVNSRDEANLAIQHFHNKRYLATMSNPMQVKEANQPKFRTRVEADGHQSLKLRILARLDRPRTSMLRPEVSTRSPTTLRWANCSRCTAVIPSITRSKRCIINGRLLRPLRTEDRYTFRTHQACNRRITGTNKRNGCSQLGTCISNQCREEVLPTMEGLRAATSSSTTCLMRRLMKTCWGCSARLGEF